MDTVVFTLSDQPSNHNSMSCCVTHWKDKENKRPIYKDERSNLQVPGHHLIEVNVEEFIINSSVDGSYVAVVSRPLIKVPIIR